MLCYFLNVAIAYDSVPHALLLDRLAAMNIPNQLTDTIRRLYSNGVVSATYGGVRSRDIQVGRGLKQGLCAGAGTVENV